MIYSKDLQTETDSRLRPFVAVFKTDRLISIDRQKSIEETKMKIGLVETADDRPGS